MIKLIKNEFIKTFKRKNIYILFAVLIALVSITIIMYGYSNESYEMNSDKVSSYMYDSKEYYEEELGRLDPNDPGDIDAYISLKASYATLIILSEVKSNNLSYYGYDYLYQAYAELYTNIYQYKDLEGEAKAQENIDKIIDRIKEDDWKYFVNNEKQNLIIDQSEIKNSLENQNLSKNERLDLEHQEKSVALNIEVLDYRLEKNIHYGNHGLSMALDQYLNSSQMLIDDEYAINEMAKMGKYYKQMEIENLAKAKYALDNEVDIYSYNLRTSLLNMISDNAYIIIIVVVFIAGGIVSEEFSKGTIKFLLIKPKTRFQILLSKFLTVLLIIPIVFIVSILTDVVVGGIVFGFDSLSVSALVYNFNTNTLMSMNVFKMVFINIITFLPELILLLTFAFAISTIITNTAVSVVLPIVGMIGSFIVNELVIGFNIKYMRYFVTLNWDLSQFLYGRVPLYEHVNFVFSLIVCIIYFIIMIIPTFIIFKKKNIKNIS